MTSTLEIKIYSFKKRKIWYTFTGNILYKFKEQHGSGYSTEMSKLKITGKDLIHKIITGASFKHRTCKKYIVQHTADKMTALGTKKITNEKYTRRKKII